MVDIPRFEFAEYLRTNRIKIKLRTIFMVASSMSQLVDSYDDLQPHTTVVTNLVRLNILSKSYLDSLMQRKYLTFTKSISIVLSLRILDIASIIVWCNYIRITFFLGFLILQKISSIGLLCYVDVSEN